VKIQGAPRGTDAQILKERELTCSAINGAMAFGYQGTNSPPTTDHWLAPFWNVGRKQAETEAELASHTRMFGEACAALGLISEALGIDPDEAGGAAPILEVIAAMRLHARHAETGEPVGYFANTEPEGQTPRFSQVEERCKDEADVLPLFVGRPTRDAYAFEVKKPNGDVELVYADYIEKYATEEERAYPRTPLYR
jgi:hypothetical protein